MKNYQLNKAKQQNYYYKQMFKRNQTSHLNRLARRQLQSHRYYDFPEKQHEDTISLSGWSISDKKQNFILKMQNKGEKKSARLPKARFYSHLMKRNSMIQHPHSKENISELIKAKPKNQLNAYPKNLLKPVNFDFEKVDKKEEDETPLKNLKYILSPNHINNLARVLKMIPNEQSKVSFTSFVKSLEEERRVLKPLQDRNRNKAVTKYYPFL